MSRSCRIFSKMVLLVACTLFWQTVFARLSWSFAPQPAPDPTPPEKQVRVGPDIVRGDRQNAGYARSTEVDESPGTFTRRIVAIGDLHGDGPRAVEVLRMAGVIDDNNEWTGLVDFLVQTGDIIDRGTDTIALYKLMDNLRIQASKVGGVVLSLLGNHEYMNLYGDWKYVLPQERLTFGTDERRRQELRTGNIGRRWANYYKIASRLPLHPSLGAPDTDYNPKKTSPLSHAALSFVHGGLAPTYSELTPFPSRINRIGRSALLKLQSGWLNTLTQREVGMLQSENGPLWYRGWAQGSEKSVCDQVDRVLESTGTRRMIMGHTPQSKGIKARCGGKIIIIDTGISGAFSRGMRSALHIEYTLTPAPEAMKEVGPSVWIEREVVKAIYHDKQEVLVDAERTVTGHLDFA